MVQHVIIISNTIIISVVLGKSAYIARVRRVLKARRAQTCAANCVKSLRKVCLEVVEKKGAATSG